LKYDKIIVKMLTIYAYKVWTAITLNDKILLKI